MKEYKTLSLTDTEISLVQMVADGMKPVDIAGERKRSPKTVETQLTNIRMKTGCRSMAHVVAILFREKKIK